MGVPQVSAPNKGSAQVRESPISRLHRGCRRFERGGAHVTMKSWQWM